MVVELLSLLAQEIFNHQILNKSLSNKVLESISVIPELKKIKSLKNLLTLDSRYSEFLEIVRASTNIKCSFDKCLNQFKVLCQCGNNETFLCNNHIKKHTKIEHSHKIINFYYSVKDSEELACSIQIHLSKIDKCIVAVKNFSKDCLLNIERECLSQIKLLNKISRFYNESLVILMKKNKINNTIKNRKILSKFIEPSVILNHVQQTFSTGIHQYLRNYFDDNI